MDELKKLEEINRRLSNATEKYRQDFRRLNHELDTLSLNYDYLKRENERLKQRLKDVI